MLFSDLKLIEPLLKALEEEGYSSPTAIQEKSIPLVLAGRDLLGVAQTGTGKTASFALPIIQLMYEKDRKVTGKRPIRALILTPTRELAIQIDESFRNYGRYANFRTKVIFGGVGQHGQVDALSKGVDILIATPGRLLDLMQQGFIDLRNIEFFVLDEADRMLDMGFVHDVKKVIAKLPQKRQSLFFSATMPPAIIELSSKILTNPAKVEVTPPSSTAHMINQSVYFVDKHHKKELLKDILKDKKIERVLVFTRTKHGADKVVKDLELARIPAKAIHGNKSQNNRQAALTGFKNKEIRVLVATDIAARGIDIDELTHVINFELPNISESYVHRIGRTGRAGASGIAIAFCDGEEKAYLRDIEKLIAKKITIIEDHAYPLQDHSPSLSPASGSGRNNFARPSGKRENYKPGSPKKPEEKKESTRPPRPTTGAPRERKDWDNTTGNFTEGLHRRETPRFPKPGEKYAKKSWQGGGKKVEQKGENTRPERNEAPKNSWKKKEKSTGEKKWYLKKGDEKR